MEDKDLFVEMCSRYGIGPDNNVNCLSIKREDGRKEPMTEEIVREIFKDVVVSFEAE